LIPPERSFVSLSNGEEMITMRMRIYQLARQLPVLLLILVAALLLVGCPNGGGY